MEDKMYEYRRKALQEFYLLPLYYMVPKEILQARKLDKLPRNPYLVVTNQKWSELYHTIGFQAEFADVWAWMMWQHLGLRGSINSYTINDPVVCLLFTLPLWAWLLALSGGSLDELAAFPPDGEVRYLSMEESSYSCSQLALLFWKHPYLKSKALIEIIEQHRTHEDYAKRNTHVRIDFLRHYYHTRTKYKHIALQNANGEHEEIPEENFDIANVDTTLWMEQFFRSLKNERDVRICKLLFVGYNQVEIAKLLGYANHSGVSKRIRRIQERLRKFLDKQDTPKRDKPKSVQQSGVKYDVIEFSYKRNT